ncbi:MAG TPA: radical SAM/SPASM domain-containing protein [Blastocatellia bacterium]|nr:radical SAM/SPASM domain-containing protein [Blastocatellia bacterium]
MTETSQIKALVQFLGTLKRERTLHTVILFVTSHCNARCRTCFYWQDLNRPGDLTFDELAELSRTMPPFTQLLLSGGEPTLREDVPEIVHLFSVNNGIRSLNFPTNGLKPERTREFIRRFLEENPGLTVYLNFSVDGLEATHDRVRAVPGNFRKAEEAIQLVQPLRSRFGHRLWVGINSVICRENYRELIPLAEYFLEKGWLDGHYFQIIRGDPLDPTLLPIPAEDLRLLYREITRIQQIYAQRAFANDHRAARWFKQMIYVGTFAFHHRVQLANYVSHRPWPMPCTAGETSLVIDYNGDVRACELRNRLGNLRDYGMNFSAFWESAVRQQELRAIAEEKCFCTHVCFLHDSLRFSLKAQLVGIPLSYLQRHRF